MIDAAGLGVARATTIPRGALLPALSLAAMAESNNIMGLSLLHQSPAGGTPTLEVLCPALSLWLLARNPVLRSIVTSIAQVRR